MATTKQLAGFVRKQAGGTIFSVKFIKRTTGETRDMVCRFGTVNKVKGDAGSGPAYDALDKGLLPVWDMQAEGFRSIPLENIIAIKIKGQVYNGPMAPLT